MKNATKQIVPLFGSAALISLILVLPFAILESLNNTITSQNFTGLVLLFGLLWLLPTTFIIILVPMVRAFRAGKGILANPMGLLVRGTWLALSAWMWTSILIDQLPCFLGVPNCD